MTHHDRTAFVRVSEVLDHAVDYLTLIRNTLDDLRQQLESGRVQMLLDSFELEQRNLLGAIKRYAGEAPDNILETFTDFSVELSMDVEQAPQPLTELALTKWLAGLNQRLQKVFLEVSESAASDDVRDSMKALSEQMITHEQKLSKEYDRFQDL